MSKNKPKVSIIIPAHNEEANIQELLKSLLQQATTNYELLEILVYSDASTDSTVDKIKQLNSPKITLFEGKKRKGCAGAQNFLYKHAQGDIMVGLDADIALSNNHVVENLIKPLVNNPKVGFVCGKHVPFGNTTFVGKAASAAFNAYEPIRGDNIFSVCGAIQAYSKEFAKIHEIPENQVGTDVQTYYSCVSNGFEYKYAPDAIIYFMEPQTHKELINSNTRIFASHSIMRTQFSKELIDKETFLPKITRYKLLLGQLFKHPIYSLYMFFVNKYCKMRATKIDNKLDSRWEMMSSTKSIHKNENLQKHKNPQ